MNFSILYLANTKTLYRLSLNLKVWTPFKYLLAVRKVCVCLAILLTTDLKYTNLSRFDHFCFLLRLKALTSEIIKAAIHGLNLCLFTKSIAGRSCLSSWNLKVLQLFIRSNLLAYLMAVSFKTRRAKDLPS